MPGRFAVLARTRGREVIAAHAARQHGLVRSAQLRAAGLDSSAVAKRVRAGRLHRHYRGVFSVGHAALSREGEWLAAVFAGGEGAVLSHRCAASLLGVGRDRAGHIDVTTLKQRRAPGVCFHRTRSLHSRDVTERRGIPVTSMARTLVDLSDLQHAYALANVIHEAAFQGSFSLLATQDAIERSNGRRHLARLHEALALHASGSAGTKSRGELRFVTMLEARGLPEPLVNVQLHGLKVDFHWPALRLAVEVDGPGHARPRTRAEDERRDATLRAAGYEVLRFDEGRLRAATEAVAARAALLPTARSSRA